MVEINEQNYKGNLQHHCHTHKLPAPVYISTQEGPPNEPSWIVTVKWGDSEYKTPQPIQGSKKYAEHIATKQVLESMETEPVPDEQVPEPVLEESQPSATEASIDEELVVPVELVTTALGIANHRIAQFKRERRYVGAIGSEANFPEQLAKLTMEIVKAVQREVERQGIEILDVNDEKGKE